MSPAIDWEHVLIRVKEIVASYDTPVTLRQLFGLLLSEQAIPNTVWAYNRLSLITRGRLIHRAPTGISSPARAAEEAPPAPEAIMEKIGGYPVHQAARLLPEPTPEEFKRLKADIKEHGLLVPIVLTPDAEILDGRTRARICEELGIKWGPKMTVTLDTEEARDPVAYVLSMNAVRRHLTGDQVIALYLEANKTTIEVDQQAAKIAQQVGLKKGSTQPEPVSTTVKPTGKTAAKIAKAVGKSKSAVERVQRVQKVAPEKMVDVAAGKVSAGEVLKAKVPKTVKLKAEPPATQPTTVKAPDNKADLGLLLPKTRKERRVVAEWLDKVFEFIDRGDTRLEALWNCEDLNGLHAALEDFGEGFGFLVEKPDLVSFSGALAEIESGALCLTPDHIKALTGWRDRIDAVLQKRAEVGGPAERVPLSPAPPDLQVQDDGDEVESEDETIQVLAETEPSVTKKNTVKAPANEQPAPKKFKPGSPRWVEEQVEALCEVTSNLQSVYPKLTGYRQERIRKAQKALEHVVRIGANFDPVRRVSLELVRLWNQQRGTQLEDEGLKYLIGDVKEAVACVPYIRPWKQVIEKVYAAHGSPWFTREHFEWLTDIRDLSDLNEIEREWATAAPETAAALDLLKGETAPAIEDLEAILSPDDQQEDEAAVTEEAAYRYPPEHSGGLQNEQA